MKLYPANDDYDNEFENKWRSTKSSVSNLDRILESFAYSDIFLVVKLPNKRGRNM